MHVSSQSLGRTSHIAAVRLCITKSRGGESKEVCGRNASRKPRGARIRHVQLHTHSNVLNHGELIEQPLEDPNVFNFDSFTFQETNSWLEEARASEEDDLRIQMFYLYQQF
jgi:hypothetical protein